MIACRDLVANSAELIPTMILSAISCPVFSGGVVRANNRILGGVIYQIPDTRDSFEFTVQKPFGSELLKAVASSTLLPDLRGELLPNGLKLLDEPYKKSLVRLRGIGLQSRIQGYSEGSCVITTVE